MWSAFRLRTASTITTFHAQHEYSGPTGLPLELGRVYILFVGRESDEVSVCGGSARLESYDYVDMIREILAK